MMRKALVKVKLAAALAVACVLVIHNPSGAAAADQETMQQTGQDGSESGKMEETLQKTEKEESEETGKAQESNQTGQQAAENNESQNNGSQKTEKNEPQNSGSQGTEKSELQNSGSPETEKSEQQNSGSPETDKSEQQNRDSQGTEQGQQYFAAAVLMNETDESYGDLSRFMSLSSDQFRIYTVAVLDASTGQPAVSPAPVNVSLDFPYGYDEKRLAVSELKMEDTSPVRTEIQYAVDENGKIVFQTDHSGLFVVMEKKAQVTLPSYLEPTEKIAKQELKKTDPEVSGESGGARESGISGNLKSPQTGDDHSVLAWGLEAGTAFLLLAAAISVKVFRNRRYFKKK